MELYYFSPSPPCRSVMLFMHALSLDPILKEVDISKGDNLKPEFVKLNPQRTIPVIVDDGFVLSESRAILGYLAEQYGGENTSYYPNDPKARGVINQRLLFDVGTLYQRFLDAYMEMFNSVTPIGVDEEKLTRLKEAFEFLEIFMGDSEWMAGDDITIADYSLAVTVSTIEACGFDLSEYTRISSWLERCKREMVNYEEANQRGANIFGQLVKEKLKMVQS
ncbi:UNVERIFIED_CONTAM: hypothetical protein PYX00_003052 [Menopon gallinae]|uniref:Uncharacterized protein n=1 Tax=Menopon gallinae TaxID=328185 RepID=A0AAW2HYW9_9NEOP